MASTRLAFKTPSDYVSLRRGRAIHEVAAPLVTTCLFEIINDYLSILKQFSQFIDEINPRRSYLLQYIHGISQSFSWHFGVTGFIAALFNSVKAFFYSRKLGYEA
jgi:hypothetical protein